MKIVIDANMVIAALVKGSAARKIIINGKFEFVSPDFVIDEIRKYENEICEKAGLDREGFELLMVLIFGKITIIAADEYKAHMENAGKLMREDIKDVPYVACCLALKCDGI